MQFIEYNFITIKLYFKLIEKMDSHRTVTVRFCTQLALDFDLTN